jgi:outer membrane protein assembly factor BamB
VTAIQECPSRRWQFRVNEEKPHNSVHFSIQSPPVVHNGTVFFCDNENELYAVDAVTGELQWTVPLRGWYIYGPTYVDGSLYLTADRHLQTINIQSRRERWARTPPDPTGDVDKDDQGWMPAAPAVHDGHVYVGTAHGVFCAFDSVSGDLKWYQSIPKHRPTQGYEISNVFAGQSAVADEIVCVANKNGRLYAFDTDSGDQRWLFQAGERLDTAPVIHDDIVYVTSASGIFAVSRSTGELVWRTPSEATFTAAAPAIAKNILVAVAGPNFPNRNLVALNATTGDRLWEVPAVTGFDSNPSIGGETVVMGTTTGLLAVQLNSGEQLWRTRSEGIKGSSALVGDMAFAADGAGYVHAVR